MPACSSASKGTSRVAPGEGLILYRALVLQRGPASGDTNRRARPVTHVFTTATDELAEDSTFQVHKGTIGRNVSEKEIERAIKHKLNSRWADSTRVLSSERFQDLWSRLESTGILELPLYRTTRVPEEGSYFLLESGSKRWAIQRPSTRTGAMAQSWDQAKLEFFAFMNER